MTQAQKRYYNIYSRDGYFLYKNLLSKKIINKIIKEIKLAKNTDKYYDTKNNLRRVEKLYNKGKNLILLNKKILNLMKSIFNENFIIFKDKFNAKPPGGDGFYPHFDGIFKFIDAKNKKKNGWYEYSNFFINILVALDECNKKNGTIELAKKHTGNFKDLLKKTKNDGTPAIKSSILKNIKFNSINLKVGDAIFFSNTCPHKSKKNFSNKNRRILYYTYTKFKNRPLYKMYYQDKKNSKNKLKALEEK